MSTPNPHNRVFFWETPNQASLILAQRAHQASIKFIIKLKLIILKERQYRDLKRPGIQNTLESSNLNIDKAGIEMWVSNA